MSLPSEIETPSTPQESIFSPLQRGRLFKLIREIGETILIAGVLFLAVNLVTARIRVEGSSMEPSLHDGEFVVINRLAYRWANPDRGEIIVFNFPLDPERRFIKRIIGLPGDKVSVHQETVFVNDIALEEPYIFAAPQYDGDWIVEEGHYFVLGDNRNNSVVIYWPINDLGVIPHFDLVSAAEE